MDKTSLLSFNKFGNSKLIHRWANSKFAINKQPSPRALLVKLDRTLVGDIEFRSDRKSLVRSTDRFRETKKSLRSKHFLQHGGNTVIKLPKLPFGKHDTLNDKINFITSHILSAEQSKEVKNDPELAAAIRKQSLLEKTIKSSIKPTMKHKDLSKPK